MIPLFLFFTFLLFTYYFFYYYSITILRSSLSFYLTLFTTYTPHPILYFLSLSLSLPPSLSLFLFLYIINQISRFWLVLFQLFFLFLFLLFPSILTSTNPTQSRKKNTPNTHSHILQQCLTSLYNNKQTNKTHPFLVE
ncbi:hypothetical protein BDC45DRAFT_519356 [Circinella umbellata]|nr:hypothetical protein BDC45DRAFT_519356 [Circinella umbellata]